MDKLISHIQHVLSPAQSWSMARCARWVRVWGWRRHKLHLDISEGAARIRSVNARLGRHVADSESTTFTHVVEREAGVAYKTAQRWVRWGTLGALQLKKIEHTAQDDLRHLDALWKAQRVTAPVIVGPWKAVEDRFYDATLGIDIRLGDSRKILEEFESESVDAIITDQPFGVAYRDSNGLGVEGDEDPEPIASWAAPAMERVLKPNSFAVLHGVFKRLSDGRYVDGVWRDHLGIAGLPMVDIAVWDKGQPGPGGYLMHQHEQVWICAKGAPLIWHRGDVDVWSIPRPTDGAHPTPKPVELHARQMDIFSPPRGLVLDPFCGTGASAVAALRTGRRYVGFEIDERWFQTAVARVKAEPVGSSRLAA